MAGRPAGRHPPGLAAHRAALSPAASPPTIQTSQATTGAKAQDGPWTTCADPAQHPLTHNACRGSFLDCFHCANCIVTAEHLPRLIALVQALRDRRQEMPEQDWSRRYGPTWSAIRLDILTKFTPAQIQDAQNQGPHDAMLDLV